jgi:hypothetical protein
MAELIVLNIDRAEFTALHRAASQGDRDAIHAIAGWWKEYEDKELACFICDGPVTQRPIPSQVLPENGDSSKLIAAPLCKICFELPPMLRLSRALKVLKRMYSAKNGKNVTFGINHHNKHHPSR